jgi:ECF sigma factor
MRQILVDYARSHGAAKSGGDRKVELDASLVLPQVRNLDVVSLDDVLTGLAKLDEQQCRIVELRFSEGQRPKRSPRCWVFLPEREG